MPSEVPETTAHEDSSLDHHEALAVAAKRQVQMIGDFMLMITAVGGWVPEIAVVLCEKEKLSRGRPRFHTYHHAKRRIQMKVCNATI